MARGAGGRGLSTKLAALGDRFRKARRGGRRAAPAAPLFELSPLERRVLLSFSPSVSGLPTAWEGTNTYSVNLGWTGSGETVTSWAINWGNATQTVNTGITNPMSVPHTYPDGPANFTITVTPTTTLRAYSAVSVQLDPTFGTRGKVIHDLHATGVDQAGGMVMQGDKVIVAGTYNNADFALARYNSNGTVDTGFGPNGTGFVTLDIRNANGTSSSDAGSAVALTPDGKIVVAGTRNGNDFAVARFTSNGRVDTTFGTGGKVTTDFTAAGTSTDIANAVAVQTNGKVVVAGSRTDPSFSGTRFGLARYNIDGTLDSTFGSGGLKTFAFTITSDPNSSGARALALQADGKIVVGGSATNDAGSLTPDFAVARLNTDGSFDSNFGSGTGQVMTDFSSAGVADSVYSLLVQPDQKIVAAGDSFGGQMAVARYTTSGGDDPTFGSGTGNNRLGRTTIGMGTLPNIPYAVAVQPDGKLILAGVAGPLTNTAVGNDFALMRFTSQGDLDTTFGTGGKYSLDIDGRADEARGVAVAAGGYIVVAGTAGTVNTTDKAFAVARLNPSNVLSVQNVAPRLTLSGSATVAAGASYTLNVAAVDPGTPETINWSINWGDGPTNTPLGPGASLSTTHTYANIGTYTITATATDEDGSYVATPLTVSVTDSGWSFRQSGGTTGAADGSSPGSATRVGSALRLTEGNSLVSALYQNLTIQPSTTLDVTFTNLNLRTAEPRGAWDAFEIALLDAAGNPIGPVIGGGRDTLFNITEGQSYAKATNVTFDGEKVSIAIPPDVAANTPAKIEVRLVNKDGHPWRDPADPPNTYTKTGSSVDLVLTGGKVYSVMWGVDEDTGRLFAFWDYNAAATQVDYGAIRVFDNTGNLPIGIDIEGFTVDNGGTAYFVVNHTVTGTPAPVLMKIDNLNAITYGSDVVAKKIDRIDLSTVGLTFNSAQGDNISDLGFDPITNKLFALFKDDPASGSPDPTDQLLVIDRNSGAVLESPRVLAGDGTPIPTTETVASAEALAFDALGQLFVMDTVGDSLYQVNPNTGEITSIAIADVKPGLGLASAKIEGMAYDPVTNQLLATDDTNDLLVEITPEGSPLRKLQDFGGVAATPKLRLTDVEGFDFLTMQQSAPVRPALWGVDEDDWQLFLLNDYRHPFDTAASGTYIPAWASTFVNFGAIQIGGSPAGAQIEDFTVNSKGVGYFVQNVPTGTTDTDIRVYKIDLMTLGTLTAPSATLVWTKTITNRTDHVTGLATRASDNLLYMLYEKGGTADGTAGDRDELWSIDLTAPVNGTATVRGTLTGVVAGTTYYVTDGQALAFDVTGTNLFAADNFDTSGAGHLYQVTTSGAITAVPDNSLSGGLTDATHATAKIKALAWDPVGSIWLGSDDDTTGSLNFDRLANITVSNGANVPLAELQNTPLSLTGVEGFALFPVSAISGQSFVAGGPPGAPGAGSGALAADLGTPQSIDTSTLSDVSGQFSVAYGRTSFNDQTNTLYVNVTLTRTTATRIAGPLLVGVRGINDPNVRLLRAHGATADGMAYYDVSSLMGTDGVSDVNGEQFSFDIAFTDASERPFSHQLVLLGQMNRAPSFTSDPYAGEQGQAYPLDVSIYPPGPQPGLPVISRRILEIARTATNELVYPLAGTDPDGHTFTFSIAAGAPAGMTIQTVAGQLPKLRWIPAAGDVGTTKVVTLRVTDQYGLFDPAKDQELRIRVVAPGQNRPPQFRTDPVVFAYAGTEYVYDSDAFDPDGQTLTYSRLAGPSGLVVGGSDGIVRWTPGAGDIGQTFTVNIQVADSGTPALTDTQPYRIVVLAPTTPTIPGTKDLTVRDVNAAGLTFDNQQLRAEGTVSATVTNGGTGSIATPFRVLFFEDVDFSGTYTAAQDHVLGSTVVSDPMRPGQSLSLGATLSGPVLFAGAHVWAFVDSDNVVSESNEANNVDRSARDCKIGTVGTGRFTGMTREWWRTTDHQPLSFLPAHHVYFSTPAVGDLNGDGKGDIVVTSADGWDNAGPVRAFNGATGAELWTVGITGTPPSDPNDPAYDNTVYDPANWARTVEGVALVDLDLDGTLEVVVRGAGYDSGLIAFDNTGRVKTGFTRSTGLFSFPSSYAGSYPAVANIDGDAAGYPEIVLGGYIFDHTGAVSATLERWYIADDGSQYFTGPDFVPVIADLNGDNMMEIIHGGWVFMSDGSLAPPSFWKPPIDSSGFKLIGSDWAHAAVGNFDADPNPEVVVVDEAYYRDYFNTAPYVLLLDTDGTILKEFPLPSSGGGAPTVADFDGDGKAEVAVATRYGFYVIDDDFGESSYWWHATTEGTSGVTGSTAFDFDLDGRAEIVYRDESQLFVFRVPIEEPNPVPADGDLEVVTTQTSFFSGTAYEMPVVADIDNDGHAEIITAQDQDAPGDEHLFDDGDPHNGPGVGIHVFGQVAGDNWATTRKIWNEHSYHVTNILDNGKVPVHETANWTNANTYRANSYTAVVGLVDAADLIPSYLRVQPNGANTNYTVRIGNAGNASAPAGFTVAFFNGNPARTGTLIGQVVTPSAIAAGRFLDVTLPNVAGAPVADLWVVADRTNIVPECDEANNAYSLIAGNTPLPPNNAPTISSRAVESVTQGSTYFYRVVATDPDPGQTNLLYELAEKPNGMTIDAGNGQIVWPTRQADVGAHRVVVRVSDGHGGVTLQPFNVRVISTNTAPRILSDPQLPAKVGTAYSYQVVARDDNGDSLLYTIDQASYNRGLRIGVTSGLLTWTSPVAGAYPVEITVSDGRGGIRHQRFVLPVVVSTVNTPPHITSTPPPGSAYLGETWAFQVTAKDIEDGQSPATGLVFSIDDNARQAGFAINPSSGMLTWTPGTMGAASVTVTVTDNGDPITHANKLSESQQVTIPVVRRPSTNAPARIDSQPTGPASTDQKWQYLVEASDADRDPVTLSVVTFADAAGHNITGYTTTFPAPGKMLLSWTPAGNVPGPVHIEVRALDPSQAGETQSFDLPVLDNSPPIIVSSVSQTGAVVGQQTPALGFDVIDYNGDALTFELLDANGDPVPGATFSPAQLPVPPNPGPAVAVSKNPASPNHVTFTFTPTTVGTQTLRLRVTDARGATAEQPIRVDVYASAQLGISLTARGAIAAGQEFSAQPVATGVPANGFVFGLRLDTTTPPTGMTIDSVTGYIRWTPTAAQITSNLANPYKYWVSVKDGPSGTPIEIGPFSLTVLSGQSNGAPTIVSSPDGLRASGDRPLIYNAVATDPDNDTPLTWTMLDGPQTAGIHLTTGQFIWQPGPDEFGIEQTATIQVEDPFGGIDTQTIVLKAETGFVPLGSPPRIVSTAPQAALPGQAYTYVVRAFDPDGEAITFTMQAVTGDLTGLTLTRIDDTSARLVWNGAADKNFKIIATDESDDTDSQAIVLTTGTGPVNQAPTITAAPGPLLASYGKPFTYQVIASDPENLPLGYYLVDAAGNPVPTPAGGPEVIRMDTSGRITWTPPAGATNQTIRVIVKDPGALSSAIATYTIQLTTDNVPTVDLRSTVSGNPAPGSTVGYLVTVSDDVGLLDTRVVLTAPWITGSLTLPVGANGLATYVVPTGVSGALTAVATAVDTAGHAVTSPSLVLTVAAVPVANPVVLLNSNLGGSVIDQPTDLYGRIYDLDGDLVYYTITATPREGAPITLASFGTLNGTTRIDGVGDSQRDAVIYTINPSLLADGVYTFKVFAQDAGGRTASRQFTAMTQGGSKTGNFSLTFTDLSTTVGPVPITVTRVYDSNKATQPGDFGYGWDLLMSEGHLDATLPGGADPLLGANWQRAYELGSRVVITLPDGTTRGFTTIIIGDTEEGAGFASEASLYLVAFLPDDDSRDSRLDFLSGQNKPLIVPAGGSLPVNLGLPDALTENGFETTVVYYDERTGQLRIPGMAGGTPFNPANADRWGWDFRLTQVDGTTYTFDSQSGRMNGMTDRAGNTVGFSPGGDTIDAFDPAGNLMSRVKIERDAQNQNRIARVVWQRDLDGNPATLPTDVDDVVYTYTTATGDLLTVRDMAGGMTRYEYNTTYNASGQPVDVVAPIDGNPDPLGRPHFLTRIWDDNRSPATPTLTAVFVNGKLDKLVDASGNAVSIGYTLDGPSVGLPAGQTVEVATDTTGFTTEVVRDARGNVVRQVQQTGTGTYLVTVYQYDERDNQTAVSKPNEVATAQRFTWQPDPATGFANRTVYDDPSHPTLPTKMTDANGVSTSLEYDSRGNVTRIIDAAGRTTINEYDGVTGLVTQTTDPTGRITKYTYDNAGNLTKVEQQLDDESFVTMSESHYNALNQLDWMQENSGTPGVPGVKRFFEYDTRGRQTASYFTSTDGSLIRSETDYDDQGRVIATRQRVGGTGNGSNGTLVSSTATSYDGDGRLLSSTDRFGNVTTLRYDARGNVVETRTPSKDEAGASFTVVTRTAYDSNGRPVATTDPFVDIGAGSVMRVTHTIYDAAGRMVEKRRLTGLQVTLTYVSGGTGTDHLGGVFSTSFAYTAATDMYGSTPAATAKLSWTKAHYDTQGRADWTEQGWKENPTGIRTNVVYDPVTGRTQKTWFDLDLDGNGSINTATERHETTYFYDALGRPSAVRNAAGVATSSRYDGFGRPEYSVDNGVVAAGVTPGGAGDNTADDLKVQVVYDDRGRKAATVDVLGRRTDYEYDDAGQLIAVTLPPVDADGSATGAVDRRRPRYEYHYDVQGNQTYVITNVFLDEATGQVTYRTIAANGTVTDTTRGASAAYSTWPTNVGHVTRFTYDGASRQLSRTLPAGNLPGAPANSFKETLVYVTAAESATVAGTWENQYGQVKYRQDVEGRVTEFRYDATTGAGRLVTARYFAAGTYNGGAGTPERTVTYKYDALGRRTQVVDTGFTATTFYTYDTDGRTTRVDSPQGTLNYAYDSRGRKLGAWTGTAADLATARTSATTLTEYAYDNLDRLVSTTAVRRFGANVDADNNAGNGVQPEKTQTVFALDGQIDYELVATATGNLTRDYSYDASHRRLTTLEYFADANNSHAYDAGEVLLGRFVYAYNNDGTRKSEVWTDVQSGGTKTTTTAWVYDDVNRLVKETYDGFDGQGAALNYTDTFTYDFSSNRTTLVHDDRAASGNGSAGPDATTTYTYDANDRLLTEVKDVVSPGTDTTTTYTYGSGNTGTDQTVKTAVTGAVTETTTFTYDAAGRMTNVQIAKTGFPTTSVAYKYNADGLRVERTVGTTTTVYHLDPGNPTGYVQALEEGTDANANHKLDAAEVARVYTLGLAVLTQATATQVLHLLADAHGSMRAVLDRASGPTVAGVVERYAYSGYGVDLGLAAAPKTEIRYAGQAIDPLTGLSFNRTRWYDRSSGRFLRLDSYAGRSSEPLTLHKYLYAGANPIMRVDPSGQFSITETIVRMGISALVSWVLRPIIKPVMDLLARAMIPKFVINVIDKLIPNIGIAGGALSLNFAPELPLGLGLTFEAAVEGVYSTATGNGAVFLAGTMKAGFVGEDPGGIHAFLGLGWNVKDSDEYQHPKWGVTVPFASLPRRMQNRVWADMANRVASYMATFLQGVATQGSGVNVTSPGYTQGLLNDITSDYPDLLRNVLHFLDKCEATFLTDGHGVELLLDYNFLESANMSNKPRLDGLGLVTSIALQIWPFGGENVKFQ